MSSVLWSSLSKQTFTSYLIIILISAICYLLASSIYNLYFHPLKKYPGPRWWAISEIPFSIMWISGSGHKRMLQLHLKYGDIVRVAPNQLSFGNPEAWDDIMGHRKRDQDENGKDPEFWRDGDQLTIVGSSRERHRRLRKVMAHDFSAQAMMGQQETFQSYATLLIDRLKTASTEGEAVEMTSWLNWTTFDIAGDLIFGEPFGCLEKSDWHPWVKLLFTHIKGIAISTAVIRFPFANRFVKLATPKSVANDVQTHRDFTKAQVGKRINYGNSRHDFMDSIIRAYEGNKVSYEEVLANAHNLIVGSSETTATTLAGTIYFLATHKSALLKLQEELRHNFKNEEEINLITVQKLDYMLAVLHEALRIYPPVPSAIPRKTPPEGSQVGSEYLPPNIILSIWQWPMFHNPKLITEPESFIPERWLGDPRFAGDRLDAVQPFSVGPRNCIGKNLAYAEMRLLLARMVWNFDFELDPRSEGWLDKNVLYFLWQKPELFVRLIPLSGHEAQ